MKLFSICFLSIILSLALLAPWLLSHDPNDIFLSLSLESPSLFHFFGRDEFGQDLFVKIIHGARFSFLITILVIVFSLSLGLIMGTLSGLASSFVDTCISYLIDGVLAFPKFLLALALLAMMGPSFWNLVLALSFSTWAGFARLVRGEVKRLKKKEFVLSARAGGAGGFFLVRRYIWPNLLSLLAVHGMFQFSAVLIAEAGLSFLGLGLINEASLGTLIQTGRRFLLEAPHLIIFPSLVLCLFLFSLNVLSDRLRDSLNPYLAKETA